MNISGFRASGKTTRLVKEANKAYQEGKNVVVYAPGEEYLRSHGLDSHIPVIEHISSKNNMWLSRDAVVFVDEIEYFLSCLFGTHNICYTSDREELEPISRLDWDKTCGLNDQRIVDNILRGRRKDF